MEFTDEHIKGLIDSSKPEAKPTVPSWESFAGDVRKQNFFAFGLHFNIYTVSLSLAILVLFLFFLFGGSQPDTNIEPDSNSEVLQQLLPESVLENRIDSLKQDAPENRTEKTVKESDVNEELPVHKSTNCTQMLPKKEKQLVKNNDSEQQKIQTAVPRDTEMSDTESSAPNELPKAEAEQQTNNADNEAAPNKIKGNKRIVYQTDTVIETDTVVEKKWKRKKK